MSGTLLDGHDVVLFDLDGTVYRGGELVPQAKDAIQRVHQRDLPVRYVTNNASKPAAAVAERLTSLGLAADAAEVSTSAQAAAAMLGALLPTEARVLVVGTPSLAAEVDKVGLVPVRQCADEPVAVVQGHSPDTSWENLAEACLGIRGGATWIACNGDLTLPTEHGELPGNGAMVAALRAATGLEPRIAGKPQRPLVDSAVSSAGGGTPLMAGDRLDTDIAGAVNAGISALFVLTGVGTPGDALAAPPGLRPTHIASDLSALHRPKDESAISDHPGWKVRVGDGELELAACSGLGPDAVSALRALCTAWWPVGSGAVRVRAAESQAAEVLQRLGLI